MSVRREKRTDPKSGLVREYYRVDVDLELPDGQRVRKRKVMATRRAAEQFERDLRDKLLGGTYGQKEVKSPIVAEFATEFMETYAKVNNKPSELRSKETMLRVHIVPMLGKLQLDQVGVREIERFKAKKVTEGKGPKTINNCLTCLRKMLATAQEWGLIAAIPAVKWMKVPTPEFDFLDFKEAERLIAAADADAKPMVTVALKTGLRLGELLGLRWDDVDLVAGRLVVRQNVVHGIVGTPKSGKSREVPLSESAVAAFKVARKPKPGRIVFSGPDGSYLTKEMTKHYLWRACRKAGLREIGWHVLRHTFASHLVMRGAPVAAVQQLLGHSTIEMTMRYAHLTPDVRRDAVRLLDGHSRGAQDRPDAEVTAT